MFLLFCGQGTSFYVLRSVFFEDSALLDFHSLCVRSNLFSFVGTRICLVVAQDSSFVVILQIY